MTRSIARFSAAAVLWFTASLFAQTAPAAPPKPATPPKPGLTLTTPGFEEIIPDKYTRAAAPATPVSPPLAWTNVPDATASFVLTLRDPDTALNHRTDEVLHWLVIGIPGASRGLPEAIPAQAQLPDGSIQLLNQFKVPGYGPPGAGAAGPYHHYTWELYALDIKLNLGPDATEADVYSAMQGHILAKAVAVAKFHNH